MSDLFLLEDCADLVFLISLCCIAALFPLVGFIGRKQCNISENSTVNFAFSIRPVFMYHCLGALSILCISFLVLLVFVSVAPDVVETKCEYRSQNYYECQYIEINPIGFESSITFSKINSAKLINAQQDNSSLFQLVLNVSNVKLDNHNWLQQVIYKFKKIANSFHKNPKFDIDSDSLELIFPIRIEKNIIRNGTQRYKT